VTGRRLAASVPALILWLSGAWAQDLAPPDAALAQTDVTSISVAGAQASAGFRSLDEDVQSEVGALHRGGVHRMHMENLKVVDHELVAVFTGKGPNVRDYRRGATMNFSKGIGAKYVELEITDRVTKQQPEFVIKEWE